jgi:hypothetical protein
MTASIRDRIVVDFLSVTLGGTASMLVLRVFYDWSFRTEFWFFLRLTAVHSSLLLVLFPLWFGIFGSALGVKEIVKSRGVDTILNCIGAAAIGSLLPAFIPWGFILIVSGQAYITSGIAALAYGGLQRLAGSLANQ